jgi:hypothetical protein
MPKNIIQLILFSIYALNFHMIKSSLNDLSNLQSALTKKEEHYLFKVHALPFFMLLSTSQVL